MKFIPFFLTLFISCEIFGQTYPGALIDSFCNQTIKYYYTEREKPIDSLKKLTFKPRNPYILKSDITQDLRTNFGDFSVIYLTKQEALEKICRTKHRTGFLEKITVTELRDTINIDIVSWTIKVTKVKIKKGKRVPFHSNFEVDCGGTLGYIPTCRFVYDKATNLWTRYTWAETADRITSIRDGDTK